MLVLLVLVLVLVLLVLVLGLVLVYWCAGAPPLVDAVLVGTK